jgi:hypothetical protein
MAITVTFTGKSPAVAALVYDIDGLVNGVNAITLPIPPAYGSVDPDSASWKPTSIKCFPHAAGVIGALVTPDLSSITYSSGTVTFNLYAAGATECLVEVQ